ncbi:MAG: 5-formyltetrahydrofolate cyclo-ligase, partial [Lysobacterales bacterium]
VSNTRRLEFRSWSPGVQLTQSSFGIDQPGSGDGVPLQELDLLLIPLVAWDERGHRLGMGAGYYDGALAALVDNRRPMRIGVAYAVQKHAGLPTDPWDVLLHQVITEEGRFTCVA